jgi:hypothetical protein
MVQQVFYLNQGLAIISDKAEKNGEFFALNNYLNKREKMKRHIQMVHTGYAGSLMYSKTQYICQMALCTQISLVAFHLSPFSSWPSDTMHKHKEIAALHMMPYFL